MRVRRISISLTMLSLISMVACAPPATPVFVTATPEAPVGDPQAIEVEEGLPIRFSPSRPASGELADPQWDFGDGTIVAGETVTHTFYQEGTYSVGFSAVDGAGDTWYDLVVVDVRPYWPTAGWRTSPPERQGMDADLLDELRTWVHGPESSVDSVVIVRHGYVVLEEYPNPAYGPHSMHLLYSTTKSVTSALIGIAMRDGFIESVDQRMVEFFTNRNISNLDSRKQSMTLEHLLTMSCGYEWEGPDDHLHTWGQLLDSGNPIQFMLNQPMGSDPGAEWYYNGGCSHLLSAILTQATGQSTLEFAREHLFGPLGINQVQWPRDPQGIYFGGQDIWLTPRDMAKFGYLFLMEGEWDGEQIVSPEWVAESSETRFTLGPDLGYGYQWWTWPEMGIYFAWGAYEQRIYVVPDLDMVVVFTSDNRIEGASPGEIREGPLVTPELMTRYILPACED